MGAIPARKNDSARPFDGTAGRSNGNRTDWASRSGWASVHSLCEAYLRCAVRCAPLQEIAETVSRALAYLTDRLIWPYCLPAKAEQCLKLHRRDAPHGQAHPRLAECARHPGAQRRRPCTRARAISRRRRRRRWRWWWGWSHGKRKRGGKGKANHNPSPKSPSPAGKAPQAGRLYPGSLASCCSRKGQVLTITREFLDSATQQMKSLPPVHFDISAFCKKVGADFNAF